MTAPLPTRLHNGEQSRELDEAITVGRGCHVCGKQTRADKMKSLAVITALIGIMIKILFGKRLNMVDLFTISIVFFSILGNEHWFTILFIFISGVFLSLIGERYLEGLS